MYDKHQRLKQSRTEGQGLEQGYCIQYVYVNI